MSRARWRNAAVVGVLAISDYVAPMGRVVAEPPYDYDDPDREHVTEYGAAIAPEDKVSSKGDRLTEVGAILQQDRFNVHARGLRQEGDSADTFFADKAHRLKMADAVLKISKEDGRHHRSQSVAAGDHLQSQEHRTARDFCRDFGWFPGGRARRHGDAASLARDSRGISRTLGLFSAALQGRRADRHSPHRRRRPASGGRRDDRARRPRHVRRAPGAIAILIIREVEENGILRRSSSFRPTGTFSNGE